MKSIGLRLFFAFLSIAALVVGQGILAHYNTSWIMEKENEADQSRLRLSNYSQDFASARFTVFEILATYNPELMDSLFGRYKNLMFRLISISDGLGIERSLIRETDETYRKVINYHYSYADKLAKNLMNSTSLDQYKKIEALLKELSGQQVTKIQKELDAVKKTTFITTIATTSAALMIATFWALALMSSLIDKKKHEKDLRKSETDLRRAQAMAKMGNWHWDFAAGKISWSDEMFKLYKMEKQKVDHEFIRQTILEEDYPIFIKAIEEVEKSEKIDITYRIKWPDGSIRFHHVEGDLIRDEKGGVDGIFGISQDVTEDILTNESLNQLRNYLKSIVDSMPSILIGVDRNLKVILLNKEAESHSSTSMNKTKGKDLFMVFPFLVPMASVIQRVLAHKLPRKEKKVEITLFGEKRIVDLAVFPLIDQSQDGAVIRVEDVTEIVVLEERMVQTEKMLSIGGLAAGMAHEINNPLAGILQNLQVVKNRLSPELKKNIETARDLNFDLEGMQGYIESRGLKTMIDSAIDSGKRAAQIVNNMLSFARKNNSSGDTHDLCKLMDRTLDLARNDYNLKRNYDFRKIRIDKNYSQDVHQVFCDSSQIQQVFLNLLKNGAEAMNDAEYTKGIEPAFDISIYNDGDMVAVEIKDNGPGMSEEVRRRVFEPFFSTKEVGMGTGLGLSVSYFIITENHEGTMSVESSQGEGTRFIISLPGSLEEVH